MKKFREKIEHYFEIQAEKIDPASLSPIFAIKADREMQFMLDSFNELYAEIQEFNFIPKLVSELKDHEPFEDLPLNTVYIVLEPFLVEQKPEAPKKKRVRKINWILFILTLAMVVFSGYLYVFMFDPIHGGINRPLSETIGYIICFTISILGIIGLHEFGHVYALKKYELGPSMPYFIPAIPPLGTFGAFVSQKNPPKNRNQLFDIGISGPLLGFIAAFVFIIIGLLLTKPITTDEFIVAYQNTHNAFFADISLEEAAERIAGSFNNYNLLIYFFRQLIFGQYPMSTYYGQLLPTHIIQIHPLAFGGWIGLLLTAINILPAGKLDGGHIARSIFGKYYWIGTVIGVGILFMVDYFLVFFLLFMGGFTYHEGPLNDAIPISKSRKIAYIGVIAIIIFCLPITPLVNIYGFL